MKNRFNAKRIDDIELEAVSGGAVNGRAQMAGTPMRNVAMSIASGSGVSSAPGAGNDEPVQLMRVSCCNCHEVFEVNIMKHKAVCPNCNTLNTFNG